MRGCPDGVEVQDLASRKKLGAPDVRNHVRRLSTAVRELPRTALKSLATRVESIGSRVGDDRLPRAGT